jgi:hypothetical protein
MSLQSKLFAYDHALEACSKRDSGQIVPGAQGDHVSRLQTALFLLDGAPVASSELQSQTYGPSTAAAILRYKRSRNIINSVFPTRADSIVGRGTLAAIDREVAAIELHVSLPELAHNVACA